MTEAAAALNLLLSLLLAGLLGVVLAALAIALAAVALLELAARGRGGKTETFTFHNPDAKFGFEPSAKLYVEPMLNDGDTYVHPMIKQGYEFKLRESPGEVEAGRGRGGGDAWWTG